MFSGAFRDENLGESKVIKGHPSPLFKMQCSMGKNYQGPGLLHAKNFKNIDYKYFSRALFEKQNTVLIVSLGSAAIVAKIFTFSAHRHPQRPA